MGRREVTWTQMVLRLPNDGTGALPLLRQMRALCRAADGASGLARDDGNEHVALPLGLVALNWLRLYLPLIAADLPQTPTNRGPHGLGFAREGFRALLGGGTSPLDLRIGAQFRGEIASALHAALREAAEAHRSSDNSTGSALSRFCENPRYQPNG
jgi:hypothetical protein